MSCRPHTTLQLLSRVRAACQLSQRVCNTLRFPTSKPWRPPARCRAGGHQCLTTSAPGQSSLPVQSSLLEDDFDIDLDLREEDAPTSQTEHVRENTPSNTILYWGDSNDRPTDAAKVVKEAVQAEAALEAAFANGATGSLRQARSYWVCLMRVLWNEQSTRLAQTMLWKHKAAAITFCTQENSLQRCSIASWKGPKTRFPFNLLSVLIGSMAEAAATVFASIDILEKHGPIPFSLKADCIRYVQRHWETELRTDDILLRRFEGHLDSLRLTSSWPSAIRPTHMQLLLHQTTRSAAISLLTRYLQHPGTRFFGGRLFILYAAVRIKNTELALRALETLPEYDLVKTDRELMQRVVDLLRLESVDGSEGGGALKVLPRLLKLGLQPDGRIHNMAIQNAIKLGLTHLAWDLVKYANDENINTGSQTNVALLKDSFGRQNLHRLDEIMSVIHNSQTLSRDPHVIIYTMNIVRDICFHQRKSSIRESLSHILTIYDRAYNRGVLVKLGILNAREMLSRNSALPDPPPEVLAFTLWTIVYLQRRDRSAIELWGKWQSLIEQEDSLFVQASEYDASFHGFILFFLRSRMTHWYAVNVLEFMLEKRKSSPSSISWGICMYAYLKFKDQSLPAIERIGDLMAQHQARVSESDWKAFIEPSFPLYNSESEVAQQFMRREPNYDPSQPWPAFSWKGTRQNWRSFRIVGEDPVAQDLGRKG